MKTGQVITLRFDFDGRVISTECQVMSCRIERFAPGDDGLTVYQSGLMFIHPDDGTAKAMKQIASNIVARAIAEQMANAKGVDPTLHHKEMPIFRGDVMTTNEFGPIESEKNKHLIPVGKLVQNRGYVCCRLEKNRWSKKWTMRPDQPRDGFTVSVHEPVDQVEQLCDTYLRSDADGRRLIRQMAAMSLEAAVEEE